MLSVNNTQFNDSEKENFIAINEESDLEHRKSNEMHRRKILAVENPVVKRRKGRPQNRRILSNIEEQQVPKSRSIHVLYLLS